MITLTLPKISRILTIITTLLLAVAGVLLLSSSTHAADASKFEPGNIIDDIVFYNNGSMTASQIQTFLNSKNPTCDTNGTKPASDWGRPDISHATLASYLRNGTHGYSKDTGFHAPPYTCTKDYKQNTPQMEAASGLCEGLPAKSNRTAAQIIKDVSDACGINPQVLIVLLQKEQSLITDTWPLKRQYDSATGFDCPDTAPCDPAYAGFFYQVYHAARQFKVYKAYPNSYNYISGRTNRIYWHPDLSRCGSSQVYIENQATAALYIYTPYRPNQAALNNLYGTGNSCSSYGNRNFWRLFTDWFGSTHDTTAKISRNLWISPSSGAISTADSLSVSFVIKNTSNKPITIDSIGVAVRDSEGNNYNFPFVSKTLAAGESYEYYQTRSFDKADDYKLWIAALLPSGEWSRTWPYNTSSSIVRDKTFKVSESPDVSLSRSMYFSRSDEYTTQDLSASSFVITNNETKAITIPELSVAARHESGKRLDFPSAKNITLQPGESYEYYGRRVLDLAGDYSVWVQAKSPLGHWSNTWPAPESGSIINERTVTILDAPNVKLVRDLYVSPNPILTGQQTGASFIIKNESASTVTIKELAVRATNSKGQSYNFPSVENIELDPQEEYTYYEYRTFDKTDTYKFSVSAKVNTGHWTNTWPQSANSTITRSKELRSKLPNVSIVRNLWQSPNANPKVNQLNSVSFILKNNENRPVTIDSILVAARDRNNANVNFPQVTSITLSPGQSYTYYESRTFALTGKYTMWIAAKLPSGEWSRDWPYSSSNKIIRDKTINLGN